MEGRQTERTTNQSNEPDFGPVLLVDDEVIDLLLAEKELKAHFGKVTIHMFFNAGDAIGMLKAIKDPAAFPGLIIVDMKLPGMSGEDFLRKLIEIELFNAERCRVMLISAWFSYDEGGQIDQLAKEFPFVSKCLQKPFKAEMLSVN